MGMGACHPVGAKGETDLLFESVFYLRDTLAF